MKRKTRDWLWLAAFFGLLFVAVLMNGCTDPEGTQRVLKQQGYSAVEITGWRPFAGDKQDWYSTGFKAVSPSGDLVTGVVTSGLFKGNTIRLD
jgi:hypothetical protein